MVRPDRDRLDGVVEVDETNVSGRERGATFFLTSSNQSFERPSVHIEVRVDGERVIADDVEVEDQHNFVGFAFDLSPGEHTLTATAADRCTANGSFTLVDGDPDDGTVLFWAGAETDPSLDLRFMEEQPGFG